MKKNIKVITLTSVIATLALLPLGNTYADTANTAVNATVSSVISIANTATSTDSNTINLNLTPTVGGADTKTATDTVSVSTNNATGYNLTLSMATTAKSNSLENGSNVIAATSGTYAVPAVLGTNAWGYRVDGAGNFGTGTQTYASVPLSTAADTIKTSSTAVSADKTVVTYGVKVDSSKPSGTYSNTVTYTATTK